jgi:hypothetical protein
MGPAIDGPFHAQVADLDKRAGIDLKRDIFDNFGDETFSAAQFDAPKASGGPSGQKPRQLLVFSLNDAKAFAGALEALKNGLMGPAAAQMFRTRDYLGTTIHTMVKPGAPGAAQEGNPPPEAVFAYAVTQRHWVLAIGDDDLVEMAIQNLNSPQPSYWSRPAVKAALGKLPAGATGYGYTDLKKLVPVYFDAFVQVLLRTPLRVRDGHFVTGSSPSPGARPMPRSTKEDPSAPPSDDQEEEPPPADPGRPIMDMAEKPSADTIGQYWGAMTSAIYRDEGGLHCVIREEFPQ